MIGIILGNRAGGGDALMIPSRRGTTIAFKKGGSSMNKRKNMFLVARVLLLSVLAQPALAEKPVMSTQVPKAPDDIKHLKVISEIFAVIGAYFVSASSDALITIEEKSEPGFFMGLARIWETRVSNRLTQGELIIRVKINDNATNRETVNVTNMAGASVC